MGGAVARTSVFGTWVPITHYGVGADLPVGPSERASARRVGQEADPYKSGRTSKNGAPGARTSVFGTWVPITHYGVGADLPVGPSERASARRVGQEADPYKSGRTSKNGAPGAVALDTSRARPVE